MTFTDSLASYELPPALVRPALMACRGFNTSLDAVFYDTPALRGDVDLGADVDPEGSLLRVDPARAPYITAWKDVVDFLDSQAAAPEPIGVASITGVGSSALGSAALAWNVAVGLKRPVLAIVPGYGLADVVLQGLGGWFGFGLHDLLSTKSHVQTALALVAPRTAAIGRNLSASAPGATRVNGAPVFRTGCGSSDVLHDLMQRLAIDCVVGHSKGALSIGNALRGLPLAKTRGLKVVTLGCPIVEDAPGADYHQYLGWFDALGALNAWGNRPNAWVASDHGTNVSIPLSMAAETLVAE
jgi:hypothetical protein